MCHTVTTVSDKGQETGTSTTNKHRHTLYTIAYTDVRGGGTQLQSVAGHLWRKELSLVDCTVRLRYVYMCLCILNSIFYYQCSSWIVWFLLVAAVCVAPCWFRVKVVQFTYWPTVLKIRAYEAGCLLGVSIELSSIFYRLQVELCFLFSKVHIIKIFDKSRVLKGIYSCKSIYLSTCCM